MKKLFSPGNFAGNSACALGLILFLAATPALAQTAPNTTYPNSAATPSYGAANSGATNSSYSSSTADWNGPYFGVSGGADFATFHDGSTFGPHGSDTSGIFGAQLGTNWQTGHIVLGVEGEISGLDLETQSATERFREDGFASARGRLGYAAGPFLPYVTGGLAVTDVDTKIKGVGNDSHLSPGPAFGGGVETMLGGLMPEAWANRLTARVEYLYVGVPKDTNTIGGAPVTGGSNNNIVRVGLNYKF